MCEMKRILLLIMMAAAFSSCRKSGVRLAAEPDSLSYVIGLNVGMNLMKMDSTLNVEAVCTAIRDVYAGTQKMTLEDAKVYYLRQMNYAKYEKFKLYEERFLEDLAKSDRSYVRNKSGVTYSVEVLGDQETLATRIRDTVVMRYRLTRQDGSLVYSSYDKADTLRSALGDLVVGLQEVMKIVGQGGRVHAWIPSELAYGSGGNEELGIAPNSTLFYEVEVVDVVPYQRR